MSRVRRLCALAVVLSAPLAGCATFGTNVNGNFACSAPDGICAPSSVIDDRALALIAGEAGAPAPRPVGAEPALLRSHAMPSGQVARPAQMVLRIVFPAHVDGQGRYHELSAVRAVVDEGTWLAATDQPAPTPMSAADVGAADIRARMAVLPTGPAESALPTGTAEPPSAAAVLAARKRAISSPPLSREEIAAEVKTVLIKPAVDPPAAFPAKVED